MVLCSFEGCTKQATFNIREEKAKFCKLHKEPDMICIQRKLCEKCDSFATFGLENGEMRFCSKHKEERMICKHKYSKCEKCNKNPTFNWSGETKARFCKNHKEIGMINVKNKTCEKCSTCPSYNFFGKKARFCVKHKEPNMINVHYNKCQICNKQAFFNNKNEKKGIYCSLHKEANMININDKRCEKCDKIPSFNITGESKPRFCSLHKEKNMINVRNKICEKCVKISSFNFPTEKNGRFCFEHKESNMVNVKNSSCEKCSTRGSYGFPGCCPTRCVTHKEDGMISPSRKRCEISGCKEIALYGFTKHIHCEEHKIEDEMSFLQRKCISCNLINILDPKTNQCYYCNPNTIINVRLRKQNEVKSWIDNSELIQPIFYDKQINNGVCGKERPDFYWDCETHILILEVDENQHKDREKECEYTRMFNITQMCGGLPVIFIRYNPDEYYINNQRQNPNIKNRRKKLIDWLGYCLSNKFEEINMNMIFQSLPDNIIPYQEYCTCKILYLYYNS